MTSTLYLEGNFLPDYWIKPNLFYQKLALAQSKVILISDSIAPDLKSWLQEKNPSLDYRYFDSETASLFLSKKENLESISNYHLFIEDRDGSIPKDIYIKALNAGPMKAFVLARWIDWVGSSKSTFTAAFTSLSVTKSVINHPSELYQFVTLYPESEALVMQVQDDLAYTPMGAYYIFNKGSTKIKPFSIYDANQRKTLEVLKGKHISKEEQALDLTDLFLGLRKIEEMMESREEKEGKVPALSFENITSEFTALKELLERHLALEYGIAPSESKEAEMSYKSVHELIHGKAKEGKESPHEESEESAFEEPPEAEAAPQESYADFSQLKKNKV
ncbi:hypothetical protein QR692_09975 [Lactococcus petauri]|uniref:hypothetical protein n=1 Tax=Lactococcus petauri TaxID=1940789 RepID=UPI00207850C6|nr:hypothetical protein [Lactococcus petauri]USI65310.1 hypothetical protein LMK05_10860 [Lactococcus petauri]USI67805.1 hypothetical protein LMK04_10095 [Lactococcus petauri]WJE12466.1 hypothetical protein QR692_09975 [Lactococcus petauri]